MEYACDRNFGAATVQLRRKWWSWKIACMVASFFTRRGASSTTEARRKNGRLCMPSRTQSTPQTQLRDL